MPKKVNVVKATGEIEPFSPRKVLRSIKRAGASNAAAQAVLSRVEKRLYENISTAEIFKFVKDELQKQYPQTALRFNLKQSMRDLGPDGFSFEKYIKEILRHYGCLVRSVEFVPGRCISHETDIVAENKNIVYFGECKYRNKPGDRIDVNVCMKLFAAAFDVKAGKYFKKEIDLGREIKPLLATNVKFSNQAIKYSKCQGIGLLGWNYPKDKGLETMIGEKKLYPITILPSFKKYMNAAFGNTSVMLAKDLLEIRDAAKFAEKVSLPISKINALVNEAKLLFDGTNPIV
ncbi:MAG: ATP cone domain-containing protein [Candidatus Pacebacteria bacterium]|nr:ATP cone domain-containing protein [Candidatus Paceibacterota bacterium]